MAGILELRRMEAGLHLGTLQSSNMTENRGGSGHIVAVCRHELELLPRTPWSPASLRGG